MDRKQVMTSAVVILLALAVLNILPISGQIVCPWCDKGMQTRLLDCVYVEMIHRPQLSEMPLQEIDDIEGKLISESDAMVGLPYVDKKVKMDEIFMEIAADAIKRNSFQQNQELINAFSDLAGNCYSLVTGYDRGVVTRDVKKMIMENIKKSTAPFGEDSNPVPNSDMPYSANQYQQDNFRVSQPQIQPPFVPANPDASYQPNTANNFPLQTQPAMNGNENNGNEQANLPLKNAPFNPTISPPMNPSDNPSFVNNDNGPSDNLRNQAQSDSSSGAPIKDDNESQSNTDSLDNAALAFTTPSSKLSSPPQNSKPSNADSYMTTLSPISNVPRKKTTETDESKDEEPCDEKFKIALYEKLINDARFCSFFGKLPMSTTNPAVPRIMNRVFKEYGIEQHYPEFSTFWKFESKTLKKESKAEDWDEVMSKICKIIFSRNNLLEEDCEEIGREIADYILDELPGDPPASNTKNPHQNNEENDKATTESSAVSSGQKTSLALSSTTIAPLENNSNSDNSTNPEDLSFPELNSKLANTFKHDGSTEQDSDKVPFSELLSAFEAQQHMATLHQAAESCKSPSGFDFKKFLGTMTNVTELIQKNHPDWSHDKCEKQMYSATVAVLTKELQDSLSNNNNAKDQSSSNQPDAAADSSDSQNSNSDALPVEPHDYDYNIASDDYPGAETDYNSDNFPQPQQDLTNYGNNPDGSGAVNILPSGNQPDSGNWNAGLKQPSNLAAGHVNTNDGDFTYRNLQNPPLSANQPYEPSTFSQPTAQNYPLYDYPAISPVNMNIGPHSGRQLSRVNPNTGVQQSPNFAPNPGVMNSPNENFGNNQFQAENRGLNAGPHSPALLNGDSPNFQPQFHQDGIPATGPKIQNGNNQQQLNPNYNSRFPANGPTNPHW